MKVLFIGGTGVISYESSLLALDKGIDLTILNRGNRSFDSLRMARHLKADVRDSESIRGAIGDVDYDVVVDWLAYEKEHIELDYHLFAGSVKQYIFISTATVYQTPDTSLPITEGLPMGNENWGYSQKKIECERYLDYLYKDKGFPATIIRPSHTYDKTKIPMYGYYTDLDRIMRGKEVIIHGDGTSVWTLTNSRDFAKGLVGLLGNMKSVGEAFHITSDEILTWNQIYKVIAAEIGCDLKLVKIPTDFIARYSDDLREKLLGDKAVSKVFDNSKIKKYVPGFKAEIPYHEGVKEVIQYYRQNSSACVIHNEYNDMIDRIISDFKDRFL